MSSLKLLNEWYGYDRNVEIPENGFSASHLMLGSDSSYSRHSRIKVSEEFAEIVRTKLPINQREASVKLYFPPSDGYTDIDYLDWIRANDVEKLRKTNWFSDWREISIAQDVYSCAVSDLPTAIRTFFKAWKRRTDQIFRLIEINEFIHRGSSEQTFEDFLLTDTEYKDRCKKLHIVDYSVTTKSLQSKYAPEFLSFGSKVALKTRKLLLPLVHEDFVKVMDYRSNPFFGTNSSNSHSYEYLKLFIAAALGKITKIDITELDADEIQNRIIVTLMSRGKDDWSNIAIRKPYMSTFVIDMVSEISKVNYQHTNFRRNFSYLIGTGALDKLSPVELCAVITGYENSRRWAESSKGKSTQEIITELMISDKLDPYFICKLMAHIIVNNLQPIAVELDFDWKSIEDLPMDWAFESAPTSSKKRSASTPKLIDLLA